MYLTYCDELGQIEILVNGIIDFCEGFAIFDTDATTVKIPINSVISIYLCDEYSCICAKRRIKIP